MQFVGMWETNSINNMYYNTSILNAKHFSAKFNAVPWKQYYKIEVAQ